MPQKNQRQKPYGNDAWIADPQNYIWDRQEKNLLRLRQKLAKRKNKKNGDQSNLRKENPATREGEETRLAPILQSATNSVRGTTADSSGGNCPSG